MAAPPEKTLKDLSGKWIMVPARSHTLHSQRAPTKRSPMTSIKCCKWYALLPPPSTPLFPHQPSPSPSLPLTPPKQQGIGWFMRRLISLATVTLTITQYTSSDDNSTHIDIHQIASPGNISSDENRILDWTYRDHSDKVFGEVKGKSRWAKLKEVDDHEFLKEGYDDLEGEHVQGYVESKSGGWTVDQLVWCMTM
ncbi:MAG: hypothetical protein LQ350_002083 [Teloschistes chrysophthalmus]|nr:MAG: hypothetical protein LQ350_002083 [Niorma chrysophthalma]